MNRIYQGKVTAVEIPFPTSEGSGVDSPICGNAERTTANIQ